MLSFFSLANYNHRKKISEKNNTIHEHILQFAQTPIIAPQREKILHPEVIIPCYKHAHYLESAIKSVTSTVPITIVNDYPDHLESRKIKRIIHNYLNCKLIENSSNLGQGESINAAIRQSANNLFIILNADDVLLPYSINSILNSYKRNRSIFLLGGGSVWFSSDTTLRLGKFIPEILPYSPVITTKTPTDALLFNHLNDLLMTMSSLSFTRNAWTNVGGFFPFQKRVCSYDDRDFQMRVCSLMPIGVIDEPLCFYRTNSSTGCGQL
jgi:GT2 family glycosyltransferase